MKKLIAAAMALAAIVLSESAIAGVYDNPHKWTDPVSNKTKIFFPGSANSQTEYTSIAFKNITAIHDRCGWARIPMGSTGIPMSIESASLTFLPIRKTTTLPDPVCFTATSVAWLTREPNSSEVWTTDVSPNISGLSPTGYSYFFNYTLFVKLKYGISNPGSLPIKISYNRSFKLNINNCGFGNVTVSATRPMTNFKFAGIDYILANLPSVTKPMICRTQGISKIRYIPLN